MTHSFPTRLASDLSLEFQIVFRKPLQLVDGFQKPLAVGGLHPVGHGAQMGLQRPNRLARSEEHTSELQSLMRISYAVFCLKKKKQHDITHKQPTTPITTTISTAHNAKTTNT